MVDALRISTAETSFRDSIPHFYRFHPSTVYYIEQPPLPTFHSSFRIKIYNSFTTSDFYSIPGDSSGYPTRVRVQMSIPELSGLGWSVVVRRRRSLFGIKACSLLVSTDESMKKAARVISIRVPQKTVGILGGKSVFSTLVFVEKIAWWSSKHGEETIPFVLCSDPDLNKELSVYDPLAMSNSIAQFDSDRIVENLRRKKELLEQAGAGCVVIPCYLLHAWHDEVAKTSRVPILHAGECVARELKRAKMRPIEAGSMVRVGVLGTNAILQAGFYQEKLEKQGFEAVVPDRATMEHIVIPAMEAVQKKDIEGAQNLLRIAIQVLIVRAVNVVILASEEMQGILPRDDPLLKKCIDPMDALARSTVEWSRSHGKQIV